MIGTNSIIVFIIDQMIAKTPRAMAPYNRLCIAGTPFLANGNSNAESLWPPNIKYNFGLSVFLGLIFPKIFFEVPFL